MDDSVESRALTLAVTVGLVAVLVGWVVAVGALLLDFAPGTNEVGVSTQTESATGNGDEVAAPTNGADGTAVPTEVPAGTAVDATTTGTEPETEPGADPDGVDEPAAAVQASIAHRVSPGETLSGIGTLYGVDWREVASINNVTDPNLIAAGRILQIPDPDAVSLVTIASIDESIVSELDAIFASWAAQTEVPVELLKAVAWQESRWDAAVVGLQGEVGIGQLLPEIHRFVETDLSARPLDATDPADSVEAMSLYLGWLLDETQGDTSATLASYHQGLVSQRNIGWNDETIQYIASVVGIRPEFVDRPAA